MAQQVFFAVMNCKPNEHNKLISLATSVGTGLTGNPWVVTPKHAPATILEHRDTLVLLVAQAPGNHAKTVERDDEAALLHSILAEEMRDINNITPRTRENILSTGYFVGKAPEAHGFPDNVVIKSAIAFEPQYSCKIILARPHQKKILWDVRVAEVTDGMVLPGFDPDALPWNAGLALGAAPSTKLVISSLQRKKQYALQVRGSDKGKKGEWSQVAFYIAT